MEVNALGTRGMYVSKWWCVPLLAQHNAATQEAACHAQGPTLKFVGPNPNRIQTIRIAFLDSMNSISLSFLTAV